MKFHINVVMLCAQIYISTKEPSSKMFQPRNTNAVFKTLQNNNGQPRPVAVDGFNFSYTVVINRPQNTEVNINVL